MTTIVYTEEVMTSKSPNSGTERNITTFTVKFNMGDEARGSPKHVPHSDSSKRRSKSTRQKQEGKISKQLEVQSSFPSGYNPHTFYITAYLPHDGGKRLKVSYSNERRRFVS